MKHRATHCSRLAILAGQLRRVQCARNDFLMRWAIENLVVGPLLLDPLLGALNASSADSAFGMPDSPRDDRQ